MILDDIVLATKRDVAQRKVKFPLDSLERHLITTPVINRDFQTALTSKPCSIIAEVKRSSPSKGVICKNFQPTIIAGTYEAGGAVAISVLTEPHFFGGNITHMTDIRNETQLPILRKDFIVDSYQIVEAKCYGADAILLIAKIHNESTIGALLKETHKRNLVAIVEVHDEADIDKALNAGASIIGINNRNLTTFQTNLDTSLRLAQKIPKDIILISESGINSRQDIESLMKVGIRTFLIGEALMRENEATSKLKMLQGV